MAKKKKPPTTTAELIPSANVLRPTAGLVSDWIAEIVPMSAANFVVPGKIGASSSIEDKIRMGLFLLEQTNNLGVIMSVQIGEWITNHKKEKWGKRPPKKALEKWLAEEFGMAYSTHYHYVNAYKAVKEDPKLLNMPSRAALFRAVNAPLIENMVNAGSPEKKVGKAADPLSLREKVNRIMSTVGRRLSVQKNVALSCIAGIENEVVLLDIEQKARERRLKVKKMKKK